MVTKPHPIITTVPYHDVSVVTVLDIDCTSFSSYLRNFLLRTHFRGVGTTAASVAMAAPIFNKLGGVFLTGASLTRSCGSYRYGFKQFGGE